MSDNTQQIVEEVKNELAEERFIGDKVLVSRRELVAVAAGSATVAGLLGNQAGTASAQSSGTGRLGDPTPLEYVGADTVDTDVVQTAEKPVVDVTAYTGGDIGEQINNAISANGGRTVYAIPGGDTYTLSTPVTGVPSRSVIMGYGGDIPILDSSLGAGDYCFSTVSTGSFGTRFLNFQINGSGSEDGGIDIENVDRNGAIRDVTFNGVGGTNAYINGNSFAFTVRDVYAANPGSVAVHYDGGSEALVDHLEVAGGGATAGLRIDQCARSTIQHPAIGNCATGLDVRITDGSNNTSLDIISPYVENCDTNVSITGDSAAGTYWFQVNLLGGYINGATNDAIYMDYVRQSEIVNPGGLGPENVQLTADTIRNEVTLPANQHSSVTDNGGNVVKGADINGNFIVNGTTVA